MRAWIFRHRLRLRVVYGPRPEPVRPIATEPRARRTVLDLAPGEWVRRKGVIVLRPMAPPAA